VNSPCPNLKKLILLASTTAITIIFFPFFNATKGFGFRAGAGDDLGGKAHGNSLRINDGSGVGTTTVGSGGGGGGVEDAPPIGDRRCRGWGGGASGRT